MVKKTFKTQCFLVQSANLNKNVKKGLTSYTHSDNIRKNIVSTFRFSKMFFAPAKRINLCNMEKRRKPMTSVFGSFSIIVIIVDGAPRVLPKNSL
jgi:hypothetical protein